MLFSIEVPASKETIADQMKMNLEGWVLTLSGPRLFL